jgi:hypothetical protein
MCKEIVSNDVIDRTKSVKNPTATPRRLQRFVTTKVAFTHQNV